MADRMRSEYPLKQWVQVPGERERAWLTRYIRHSVAPGASAAEFRRFHVTDVRSALPLIQVPTLVFADSDGEEVSDPAGGGFTAERIAGARLILHSSGADASSGWQHWYARGDATLGLEVRAGLHTGEVETIDSKVGGMAVNIGARVGALAGASKVLVSNTVKDFVVGSDLTFEDVGEHELKGVPDRWHLYRVVPEEPDQAHV